MKNSGTNQTEYKCNNCSLNALPSNNSRAYYCCEPFQFNKLLCSKCKFYKQPCNQCKKKVSSYEITLSKIQKINEKEPINSQIQKTPNSQFYNKTQSNCFECQRTFKNPEMSLQKHEGCQNKLCYPCLYRKYKDQKQHYQNSNQKLTGQERLLMNCCNKKGISLYQYVWMFRKDICVFCGIRTNEKQCMFQIQKEFSVCKQCVHSQLKSEKGPESVEIIKRQFQQRAPHQCLFCEEKIDIFECHEYKAMFAFNRKLCLNCFVTHSRLYSNPVDLLKGFKVVKNVSQQCRNVFDLEYFKCSQPECDRKVLGSFKENKNGKLVPQLQQLEQDLVEWRNNKIYCGICLYFKYQNKRKQMIEKIKNKQVSQTQVQQFQAEKVSYQNYFDNKCLICLTQPSNENRHRLLIGKDNREYKKQLQQHRLQCEYCQKCLFLISQDNILDIQLLSIRQQMFQRDTLLESKLFQINHQKKQFLFKKYSRIAILTNKQFNKFWPIEEKISKEKKQQQVRKKYLSLANKNQNNQNNQIKNKKQSYQDQYQTEQTTFKQFQNKQRQSKKYQQETNKFEQFDFDDQTLLSDEKSLQNFHSYQKSKDSNNNKNNNTFNKYESRQNIKRKVSQPQIFLSVCLQSFEEQHEDQLQTNGKEYLKILHQYILSEEVAENVSSFPYGQMQEYISNPNLGSSIKNNEETNEMKRQYIETSTNNKLITRSINDMSLNTQRESQKSGSGNKKLKGTGCKVLSCVNKQSNQSNKRPVSRQSIQQNKRNQLECKDEDLLNLGMICDKCFIGYLIGDIDLESQVRKEDYQHYKKSAIELSKQLQRGRQQVMVDE